MAKKIELTLTEDMLKLISNIRFKELPEILDETKTVMSYAIDIFSLYGGSFLFENIALILGRYDEVIPNTEEDAMGPKFEDEFESYMYSLHTYIVTNLDKIESLLHQFATKGGLVPGTYVCDPYIMIWEKV